MFQIRVHGRGGQGVVTAAELLSVAAFDSGREAQAIPSFGSERTGAPVVAFCRIDDRPIRLREPVLEPDALIIADPTLLTRSDVFARPAARRLRAAQLGAGPAPSSVSTESARSAAGRTRSSSCPPASWPSPRRPPGAERGAARWLRGDDRPGLAGLG